MDFDILAEYASVLAVSCLLDVRCVILELVYCSFVVADALWLCEPCAVD